MDQDNSASDELQQAINNITNPGDNNGYDAVAAVTESVAAAEATADLGEAPAPEIPETPAMPEAKAVYGDPDLDRVKSMALSDLRPIIEKIDIEPAKKFKIYKEIIDLTEDKACIEPAYNAAKQIEGEKDKAEALLFIVETIDKLGIPMESNR
ncbi:MAG: hypothetical protein MJ154_01355 [Candidatus Saccharibacteria bacterium]|nr:hypothetical protein [Candidatus Saccharibacteria bacterium]